MEIIVLKIADGLIDIYKKIIGEIVFISPIKVKRKR